MRAICWLASLGLLACSPPVAQPSIAPHEPPVQSAAPVSAGSSASAPPEASTSASASTLASARPPTPRAPLAKVVPRATVLPITDSYDDRPNEGWPEISYEGFPAVSADGTRVALVEERDGWRHVPRFGVRIIDAATAKSVEWFELSLSGTAPASRRASVASVPTMAKRAAAMNETLAKTEWLALVGTDAAPDASDVWHVRPLAIAVTWTTDELPQPKRLVVRDEGTTALVADRDLATWSRKGIKCARNDLQLVGASERLLVFKQGVGPTLHDCDGVAVPTAYRVVPLARQ